MNQYQTTKEPDDEPGAGWFAILLIGMVLLFIFGSCNAPPVQDGKRRPVPTTKKTTNRTPMTDWGK